MPGSTSQQWSRRKIMIAVLASIGILAMLGTLLASLLMPFMVDQGAGPTPRSVDTSPTTTTPAVYIAPLSVRPVVQALVATPEKCQPGLPPPPAPPGEPLVTCDVEKKAEYQLGPVALQLNLTGAKSIKLPMTQFYSVQMAMDSGSGAQFGQYTGTQVGKQVAFVRDGVVLAAAAISEPINGESLQLSGDFTAETAETIARMLREGT
jgi:hypothetical protein